MVQFDASSHGKAYRSDAELIREPSRQWKSSVRWEVLEKIQCLGITDIELKLLERFNKRAKKAAISKGLRNVPSMHLLPCPTFFEVDRCIYHVCFSDHYLLRLWKA